MDYLMSEVCGRWKKGKKCFNLAIKQYQVWEMDVKFCVEVFHLNLDLFFSSQNVCVLIGKSALQIYN